jgi:hypothetical protein
MKVIYLLAQSELALTKPPIAKMDGHLGNSGAAAFNDKLKANFVADGVQSFRTPKHPAWQGEISGSRILNTAKWSRHQPRHAAVERSGSKPVFQLSP